MRSQPTPGLALLALLAAFSTGGLCIVGPSPSLPPADTCDFSGSVTIDTLEIGPNGSGNFVAWNDGDTMTFTVGGQGSQMASLRFHISGGGDPPCVPQTVIFRDKAGAQIAGTAGVGPVATYPDGAGGRSTKALYVPGSYPTGERLTVTATIGNRSVTHTLNAGPLLATCSQALACYDRCTTATCSCEQNLSSRARSLLYRITDCQRSQCNDSDGGDTCQRDSIHGGDGGVACSQPVTSHCAACLAERGPCEADQ